MLFFNAGQALESITVDIVKIIHEAVQVLQLPDDADGVEDKKIQALEELLDLIEVCNGYGFIRLYFFFLSLSFYLMTIAVPCNIDCAEVLLHRANAFASPLNGRDAWYKYLQQTGPCLRGDSFFFSFFFTLRVQNNLLPPLVHKMYNARI